jgi:hypothetical protein
MSMRNVTVESETLFTASIALYHRVWDSLRLAQGNTTIRDRYRQDAIDNFWAMLELDRVAGLSDRHPIRFHEHIWL